MKINRPTSQSIEKEVVHEGATAARISKEQQLKRSVLTCLLWEDSFYESGIAIADRIKSLIKDVKPEKVAAIAFEARTKQKLRHVPLKIIREMARLDTHKHLVAQSLFDCIQRADEMAEFLAMYWADNGGKKTISAQVKKGIAKAFTKFDEYSFAKYKGDGDKVKLRDALFLTHAKPSEKQLFGETLFTKNKQKTPVVRNQLYKKIAEQKLTTPDTWEVELSAGKDKKDTFTRLMTENKLGALAFIRNLRNMKEAGVDRQLVKEYSEKVNIERVLPFRFIAAARYVPAWEDLIEAMMFRCLKDSEKLNGKTIILVDNSGSMYGTKVSSKSEIDRSDAACALSVLLREICDECLVISFSDTATVVPTRRGFSLVETIKKCQKGGTHTANAIDKANKEGYNRIILVTDEQSSTSYPNPLKGSKAYCINVASNKNGIGYNQWVHIDGWSEAIVDYIKEYEKLKD